MTLLLASASSIRASMLAAAGVDHEAEPARVDEEVIKLGWDNNDLELATALAGAKALDASARHSGTWVIGSDSLVSVDGRRYDKPATRDEAATHLRAFSARELRLTSAVVLAIDGRVDWQHSDEAILHVRPLSEHFIHSYLEMEWPAVGHCVGVFRMEGRGITLFDRVEGSHFTILGMPLIPLLGALRDRELMAA